MRPMASGTVLMISMLPQLRCCCTAVEVGWMAWSLLPGVGGGR